VLGKHGYPFAHSTIGAALRAAVQS